MTTQREALLNYRQHARCLWALVLVLVMGITLTAIKPVLGQTALGADEHLICLGTGGMKVVKFLPDGSAQERASDIRMDCPLCGGLVTTLPEKSHTSRALQANASPQPAWHEARTFVSFERLTPPAHAPPLVF